MREWKEHVRARLAGLRLAPEREHDVVEELAQHLDERYDELVRSGISSADAQRIALDELLEPNALADRMRLLEQARAPRPQPAPHAEPSSLRGMIWNVFADLRYGHRAVKARPTFAAVVMLTLALGIGVNVAIASLFQQILLRPLPVPEPDRLVNLTDPVSKTGFGRMYPTMFPGSRSSDSGSSVDTTFSYPMFRDLEREQQAFTGLAAHRPFEATLTVGNRARLAAGVLVSGSYFSVLGLTPALGRLLGPDDDRVDGQADSVVLSHAFWQNELGGDAGVLGQTLVVSNVPLTIVGVAPRGFQGTAVNARASVFVPITISLAGALPARMAIPNHERRDFYWAHLFARLKPGVTREAAAAAVNPLYRAILSEVEAPLLIGVDGERREAFLTRSLVLEPGPRGQTSSEILAPARKSLELLLAVSGVVLLLCCANVGGLMLLRATSRGGEMAVRASLGATGGRLASLQLAESLVLALPAAVLSLPIAWLTLRGASVVPGMPAAAPDTSVSAAAALGAIGVALVSAVAVGLVPVRGLIRTEPGKALQGYGARHTSTKGVARFRAALATVQVALSMALLATMGVFAQSLANIARLDLGVEIDSVVMFSLAPPLERAADVSFMPRVAEALEAVPGVSSVATSATPVLSLNEMGGTATVPGVDADALPFSRNFVSPEFFRTFGIELLAGRELDDADVDRRVTIVSRRFAERFGLAGDALVGRSVDIGALNPDGTKVMYEIVGVVGDMRSGKITDEIDPQVFVPSPSPGPTFYVRGTRRPDDLIGTVRETVAGVEPAATLTNLQTMEQQFRANIAIERFFAAASTAFAVLATVLAALGLYGVLAYSVAQRSREIGLRIALGAAAGRVRGMVLRQVARMAVIGAVLGAVAAVVLGRAAQSLLFGVEAGSPLALAAAAVVLAAVTFGAAYIPARRASRVDPMTVLRYE
jgi:putative ABC transport system permease protein